jgi:hypothetical protein
MKREKGNWVSYRERFGLSKADEIDLHLGRRDRDVLGMLLIAPEIKYVHAT